MAEVSKQSIDSAIKRAKVDLSNGDENVIRSVHLFKYLLSRRPNDKYLVLMMAKSESKRKIKVSYEECDDSQYSYHTFGSFVKNSLQEKGKVEFLNDGVGKPDLILKVVFHGFKEDSANLRMPIFGSASVSTSTINSLSNAPAQAFGLPNSQISQPGQEFYFRYVITVKCAATILVVDSRSGATLLTSEIEGHVQWQSHEYDYTSNYRNSLQWQSHEYDYTSNYRNSSSLIVNPWRYSRGFAGLNESDYLPRLRGHYKEIYHQAEIKSQRKIVDQLSIFYSQY